jgi:hypothetical protein
MPTTLLTSGRDVAAPAPRPDSREARLRPECASLYPGLAPDRWESAAILADRVLAYRLIHGNHAALQGRVLLESDFEFRGGVSRGGERRGRRWPGHSS